MNCVELPWPPRQLSPNARPHFLAKSTATKLYRDGAYWLAYNALSPVGGEGELVLRVEFYPPDRRRRDLDSMFSSIKAGLDGIADAMAVNDYCFAFHIHRREPVKGGKVVVTILEPLPGAG